jgi:WD40 repeat protein
MPRPERPLDVRSSPIVRLAADLRNLREKAGKPGYRQMAARANYSVATLSAAASGRRLPTLEVTLAYVTACDGDPADWERYWREVERLSVAPTGDPAAADGSEASPYPGLATFQPEDAPLFFGRTALVGELVSRLRQKRFLAVFGPSGAGKSSVVRAGLIPAMPGPAVVLTPGAHPMAELAVHLARHTGLPAGGLLEELRDDPARAALLVRQGLPGTPADGDLLVVVDQFEEIFASCADPVERAQFVAALLAMCREPDGRARVVLAVRADHYALFTDHPRLLAALADAQVLIGGMSPAELREAVTGPAEQRGARVEGALVATIVAEVADSPGALPLAAHALREAWRRRQGAIVTLAGYQAAGGVAGAVAHTAEQTYERLPEPERLAARRVLLRMADIAPDGLITRRRLSREELDAIDRAPAVIEAFAAARLVSTDRDTAEIAHEALIRAWPRLRGWVEESRTGLRLHRQLTEAATVWTALGRDDGALYRGLRLSATLEAADTGIVEPAGAEREFLEASRALRDREARLRRRRTRRAFAGLVAVLNLVCLFAAGTVVSARRAESERDRAVARELAAGARAERMTDPELALLLASRAYRLHPDAETESVLRQATADTRTTSSQNVPQSSIAVSGSLIAGADPEGLITVRRLEDGSAPTIVPVQGYGLALGPDARLAILTTEPESPRTPVVLWRPGQKDARRLPAPRVHTGGMSKVAYSPDGRWVAAISEGAYVHVWDTTGDEPPRPLGHTGQGTDLAFGPGGRLALTADDGTVRIWDVAGTAPPVVIRQPREFSPVSVAVSPDGDSIAVGGLDRVMVWPGGGRGEPQTYRGPEYWYTSLAFSADGRRIAAGTNERTIRIWNVADNSRGLVLRGHRGGVRHLAFSPDGRRLVSGGDDSTVRVWDTAAGPVTYTVSTATAFAARLSADGGSVAVPAGNNKISVFPVRAPQNAVTLRNAPDDPESLAVSGNGRAVAASAPGVEQIRWWRTETGIEPAILDCPGRRSPHTKMTALGDDGQALAVNCGHGELRLWRADGSRAAVRIENAGPIAISPDAGLVAALRNWTEPVLWDPVSGGPPRTLKGQSGPADHIRFSPDGRRLAVAGNDGTIRVWDVAAGTGPTVLTGTVGQTTAISFSPDGSLIAGVSTDDVVRLWNTDGSGEPLTLDQPAARQLVFSADGRQLVSLYGTTVRFTPCEVCGPIEDVLALAGKRTIRDYTPEERGKYLRDRE